MTPMIALERSSAPAVSLDPTQRMIRCSAGEMSPNKKEASNVVPHLNRGSSLHNTQIDRHYHIHEGLWTTQSPDRNTYEMSC
jgi:bifunctional ADP-heptose synthase (sugar kinase/adenylyltransferase)